MPYRHAHWVLLVLMAPAIAVAFWPDYLGVLGTAPFAFHAHGITATAWLALIFVQSWSAHNRRFALHRAAARAVLFVVPLFAGGAALVLHSMAVKFATASHPFYAVFGARLGLHDLISTSVLVAMVRLALVNRRWVGLHAAYMLGTPLLVLPAVIERLPGLPHGVHLSEIVPMAIALGLYLARRKDGRPFLIVIATMAVEIAAFETVAASAAWSRAFVALSHVPAAAIALPAMAAAAVALWTAWNPWAKGRAVA